MGARRQKQIQRVPERRVVAVERGVREVDRAELHVNSTAPACLKLSGVVGCHLGRWGDVAGGTVDNPVGDALGAALGAALVGAMVLFSPMHSVPAREDVGQPLATIDVGADVWKVLGTLVAAHVQRYIVTTVLVHR